MPIYVQSMSVYCMYSMYKMYIVYICIVCIHCMHTMSYVVKGFKHCGWGGVINEGLKLLHPLPMLAMFYAIVFSILRCLSDHYSLHILIKFTPSFSELRRNLTSQLIT